MILLEILLLLWPLTHLNYSSEDNDSQQSGWKIRVNEWFLSDVFNESTPVTMGNKNGIVYPPHRSKKSITTKTDAAMVLTLLNGTKDDIKSLSQEAILSNIWTINKLPLTETARSFVWEVIKGNRNMSEVPVAYIEELGQFVLNIPEQDLYRLNMSDSDIVQYLGMITGFSRRQLGAMAYAIYSRWTNEEIFESVDMLNKINGLLCGFSEKSLEKIPAKIIININTTVLHHVTGCTHRQLQVLITLATEPNAYGPPSSWSSDDVDILGLLITGLDPEDIKKIRPRGIGGLKPDIMNRMSLDQLLVLKQSQIDALPRETLSVYRRRTGNSSDASMLRGSIVSLLFLFGHMLLLCSVVLSFT